MRTTCDDAAMLTYTATTMAEALTVARAVTNQSRDAVAAGASRHLAKPISRDTIRRLEGHSPAPIPEDRADPIVLRAIAAHFECPVADLSPRAAEILRAQGIPELHEGPPQNWKWLRRTPQSRRHAA